MIGIGFHEQYYLKLPSNTSTNHYSIFPYGPQDIDIHVKIPLQYGISVSPSYTFSLIPGAYNCSFEDGFYYDPEPWISLPENIDNRPEYVYGENFLYAEGETYISHKFYGLTISYESPEAFEIGVGLQFVRRKITDVSYNAYDDYVYSYTDEGLDWYYSYNTFIGESQERFYMQNDIQFPIYAGYLFNTDYSQIGSYLYFYLGRYKMFGFRLTYSFGFNRY